MIIANPELHRNLWLKFSAFRLLAVPVLIGLALATVWSEDYVWTQPVYDVSLKVFMFALFLWGNYEAAQAIQAESKNKTWDFQKMSSIGPWQLVWGKLFGATSYVWYFGMGVLVLAGIAKFFMPDTVYAHYRISFTTNIFLLCLSGIMGHASALAASLQYMHEKKVGVAGPALIGIVVSYMAWSFSSSVLEGGRHYNTNPLWNAGTIKWHDLEIQTPIFMAASMVFFFFWIVLGLQRSIRKELQFRNSPVAWTCFTLSLVIYMTGYSKIGHTGPNAEILYQSFTAFTILALITYMGFLSEAPELAKYKRFVLFWQQKAWRRVWEETAIWVPSFLMILPVMLYILFLAMVEPANGKLLLVSSFTFSALLFMIRDGIVAHILLLGRQINHGRFALLFYYTLVYALLPMLVLSLDRGDTAARWPEAFLANRKLAYLFYPIGHAAFWASILPPLLQTGFAAILLQRRLRKKKPPAK